MNSDLSYCYLCRSYHDDEEGRCAWSRIKKAFVWIFKIYWYGIGGVGVICGAAVLVFLGFFFILLFYSMLAEATGLPRLPWR